MLDCELPTLLTLAYPQYRQSISPHMTVTDWLLGAAALGSDQREYPVLKLWWEYLC